MNVRKQFLKLQWAIIIFFFLAFFTGVSSLAFNGFTIRIIVAALSLICIGFFFYMLTLLSNFEPENEFYYTYDEIQSLKRTYENLEKECRADLIVIGEHEAFKGFEFNRDELVWEAKMNSEPSAKECDASKDDSSNKAG